MKKYNALLARTDDDGLLRYAFQFAGAQRTWRWAGRGFQAQNLAKPIPELEKAEQQEMAVQHLEVLDADAIEMLYPKPMGLLSTCVRPVAQAPEGKVFVDADLSAIENIVLGWMAGCERITSVFEKGLDPYLSFAQYLYSSSYEALEAEFNAGNKKKRTMSKPATLGCGYMLGAGEERENKKTGEIEGTGLLGYAWNMGVRDFTLEDSKKSVTIWRETYLEVPEYWKEIDRAARACIRTGRRHHAGPVSFDRSGPFMRMRLPSGRHLHYFKPRIEMKKMAWKDRHGKPVMKEQITYEGLVKGVWVRQSTHPGKLTENADQAIARDFLAHGMRLAKEEFDLDIRLHVHDQILSLEGDNYGGEALKILQECMAVKPKWAPTIPLQSAGFTSRIFMKD